MAGDNSGTIDGGSETDTVVASNLNNYSFSNVEILDEPTARMPSSARGPSFRRSAR